MTRCLTTLALLAAALAAGPAAALDWTGRVGFLYGREDTWAPGGVRLDGPRTDLDLGLQLNGALFRPGVFDYSGGVDYRRLTNDFGSRSDDRDRLSYNLAARVFGDPRSALHLDLRARRSEEDHSSSSAADATSLHQTFSADLAYDDRVHPSFAVGYTRDALDQDVPLVGNQERTIDTLRARSKAGSAAFSYGLDYRGSWSDGTYVADRYTDHRVELNATAMAAPNVSVRLHDELLLRFPTTGDDFNPRQEFNAFTALVRVNEREPSSHSLSYSYGHGLTVRPAGSVARNLHRVLYGWQAPLAPEWRIRLNTSASLNELLVDDETQQTAGETLAAQLFWRRGGEHGQLEVRGGPSVGLLHPEGEATRVGHGAAGGVQLSRPMGEFTGHATYSVAYRTDLDAEQGWSVQQQALAGVDGRLGAGHARGQLSLTADRRGGGSLGGGASRGITGSAGYRWRGHDLSLQVGVADNTSGAVEGVSGDGLFIPAPYDSHSRHVSGFLSAALARHLRGNLSARYASSDFPDRPSLAQIDAAAGLELGYGALRIALEDRYSVTETSLGSTRINQVFVRLTRVFGSRY